MPSEFELIARHFQRPVRSADLGVGDDAALVRVSAGNQLVVSTDMLVEGTHFLAGADPRQLGWKTIAVSVSDLAAMAAQPRWATLAISLPDDDDAWLAAFADGVFACCASFDVELVGGDTTRGPRNLCATLFGEVPAGQAVTRAGARPGDDIWISGQPGRAALALTDLLGGQGLAAACRQDFVEALHGPRPRLALGIALRGLASAMLDVSDGLLGDLAHILERSQVGARLFDRLLPLQALIEGGVGEEHARRALLGGGDDYELLFCAAPSLRGRISGLAEAVCTPLHRVGTVLAEAGRLELEVGDGACRPLAPIGFRHFTGERDDY